jgi:hypothetical protein
MNLGNGTRRNQDDMYEHLLPTAVIAQTGHVTAVSVRELDTNQESDDHSEPRFSTATRFVVPSSVQLHHPTFQSVAKNQSRMIERRILSSNRDDGAVVQEERMDSNASADDASWRSAMIADSIAAGMVVDDLDPLFLQQLRPPVRDLKTMSKEEKIQNEDFTPEAASGPPSYQVSEYKSVYEISGITPYTSDESGYKINEYKSIYGV